MSEERILTQHPDEGKNGTKILKEKYHVIKEFILETLSKRDSITFAELTELAVKNLENEFEGSVTWYLVTVKLDLEAKNIIERLPDISPQKLRLKK